MKEQKSCGTLQHLKLYGSICEIDSGPSHRYVMGRGMAEHMWNSRLLLCKLNEHVPFGLGDYQAFIFIVAFLRPEQNKASKTYD